MGKPNKYAKAEIPEVRVLKPAPALTRKDKRKIYFGPCPCSSGKAYKNCCLPKDIKEKRKRGLEAAKKAGSAGAEKVR